MTIFLHPVRINRNLGLARFYCIFFFLGKETRYSAYMDARVCLFPILSVFSTHTYVATRTAYKQIMTTLLKPEPAPIRHAITLTKWVSDW
jgi:hypothetical protein